MPETMRENRRGMQRMNEFVEVDRIAVRAAKSRCERTKKKVCTLHLGSEKREIGEKNLKKKKRWVKPFAHS